DNSFTLGTTSSPNKRDKYSLTIHTEAGAIGMISTKTGLDGILWAGHQAQYQPIIGADPGNIIHRIHVRNRGPHDHVAGAFQLGKFIFGGCVLGVSTLMH